MKLTKLTAVILAASFILAGCGNTNPGAKKQSVKKADTASSQTGSAAETESDTEESCPEGEFLKLPDEALDAFDQLTVELKDIFPDIKGKLMYGYTGEELIPTRSGEKDCYIFDYYTYKKKIYTKIATVALEKESSIVYLLEDDGTYSEAETDQPEELKWCETATPALAVAAENEISE